MQLRLSEGAKPEEKRLGYRRALARAYMQTGQPEKAIPHLEELLAATDSPEERLELLCSLADAQVRPTPCRYSSLGKFYIQLNFLCS